jgi:hypothetical protein
MSNANVIKICCQIRQHQPNGEEPLTLTVTDELKYYVNAEVPAIAGEL